LLSGSVLVSINQVTLRRAQLVLGWVTIFGGAYHFGILTSHPGQLSLLFSVGRPKGDDAVRLGSKGNYGSFQLWINMWISGRTMIPLR